jgi:hypothetical protein
MPLALSQIWALTGQSVFAEQGVSQDAGPGKQTFPVPQSAVLPHSSQWPATQIGFAAPQSALLPHSTQPSFVLHAIGQDAPFT